jgi:hypothetical protein
MPELFDDEEPRAITPEELRDRFMETCRSLADYWADPANSPSYEWPDRVRGLLHSFLVIFDGGGSGGLPALDITARPHPDDQRYYQDEGENWISDGTVINSGTMLHEHLYEGTWVKHRGPHYRQTS